MPENNFFNKLKAGLSKTRNNFVANLEQLFQGAPKIDEELFADLEDTLIMADVGVETTTMLLEKLRLAAKEEKINEPIELKQILMREMSQLFTRMQDQAFDFKTKNKVYLVVGVNGVGKTTTIAKLASHFKAAEQQVLLVAADTFRAAATEQLMTWGERLEIPVIHHQEGADPAAVVYDGMMAAKARKADVVIIDTAGRLHTKVNLMEELKKVQRIVTQNQEGRDLEILLVLDATTGQNAISQAKVFHEAIGINRLILTKLDGTAKGGITLAIANQFRIPIALIGVGEKQEDLQIFDAIEFTRALFE